MMSGLSGFCGGPVSPALRPMPGVQRRPLFHFPIRALYIKHLQAYNTAGQLLSFCCSQSSAIICDHLDLDHPLNVSRRERDAWARSPAIYAALTELGGKRLAFSVSGAGFGR